MRMIKRLKTLVTEQQHAQRQPRDEALGGGDLGPREALNLLKTLNAPIGPVETMVEETVAGRYS